MFGFLTNDIIQQLNYHQIGVVQKPNDELYGSISMVFNPLLAFQNHQGHVIVDFIFTNKFAHIGDNGVTNQCRGVLPMAFDQVTQAI